MQGRTQEQSKLRSFPGDFCQPLSTVDTTGRLLSCPQGSNCLLNSGRYQTLHKDFHLCFNCKEGVGRIQKESSILLFVYNRSLHCYRRKFGVRKFAVNFKTELSLLAENKGKTWEGCSAFRLPNRNEGSQSCSPKIRLCQGRAKPEGTLTAPFLRGRNWGKGVNISQVVGSAGDAVTRFRRVWQSWIKGKLIFDSDPS